MIAHLCMVDSRIDFLVQGPANSLRIARYQARMSPDGAAARQ
jgi:hypothetical protein